VEGRKRTNLQGLGGGGQGGGNEGAVWVLLQLKKVDTNYTTQEAVIEEEKVMGGRVESGRH